MSRERSRKQFLPLFRSCETRVGLFMCTERSRKQFSPVWWSCKSSYRPVYEPGKIDKIVFVTVEVLRNSYSPVYVQGTIEKAVLTSVADL